MVNSINNITVGFVPGTFEETAWMLSAATSAVLTMGFELASNRGKSDALVSSCTMLAQGVIATDPQCGPFTTVAKVFLAVYLPYALYHRNTAISGFTNYFFPPLPLPPLPPLAVVAAVPVPKVREEENRDY